MPDQLQLRGGTTTEHNSFTGASKEVTVDTTKKTLVVHDGATQGGIPLMKESGGNAASSVSIGTGGTNAINIDSSQRVGIGTASPSQKLEVSGNLKVTSGLALLDNDQRVQWGSSNVAFIEGNDNEKLVFGVGAERMRINSSGNVGIGTTSPQVLMHLNDANARIQFTDSSTGTGSGDGVLVGLNGDDDFFINNRESGKNLLFFNGGSQRLTINSDGRVGIGTSDPSTGQLVVYRATVNSGNPIIQARSNHDTTNSVKFAIDGDGDAYFSDLVGIGTTTPQAKLQVNDTNPVIAEFYRSDGGTNDEARIALGALSSNIPSQRGVQLAAVNNGAGHDFSIRTSPSAALGPTEKMKVTHDGTIFLSSNTNLTAGGSATLYVAGSQMQVFRGNQGDYIIFKTTSNTIIGTIKNNGNTGTQYNTSSDYRLKENQTAISDGITRLKTLKPYRFNWKSDSSRIVDGFFAHEVTTAVPEAISGTKDAIAVQEDVDEGRATNVGDPVYQSIDHSKLVPLLTAALQEAVAKIETLETKVATLEAK